MTSEIWHAVGPLTGLRRRFAGLGGLLVTERD